VLGAARLLVHNAVEPGVRGMATSLPCPGELQPKRLYLLRGTLVVVFLSFDGLLQFLDGSSSVPMTGTPPRLRRMTFARSRAFLIHFGRSPGPLARLAARVRNRRPAVLTARLIFVAAVCAGSAARTRNRRRLSERTAIADSAYGR
jgi:hypothetical protein